MAEGRGRLAAAACAAFLATSWATTCAADERRSVTAGGLVGTLSFEDAAGQPVAVPPPGRSLRLVLALEDAVTGEASRGLRPAAWIRAVEPGGGDCAAAGRAFRATGRLPIGTIDLNGIVMAASFADGAVTLVDPRLDLATANLRAAHAFGAPPAFILGLREAQAFLLGFASPARLVAFDAADGSIRDLAGVARPTAAAPAGAGTVFVADAGDGSLVLADLAGGPPRARWPLGPDPRLSAGPGGHAVAWSPAGSLLLLIGTGADPALRLDRPRLDGAALVPEPPAPPAPPAAAAVALLDGPSLEVVWLDALGHSTVIDLGAPADLLLAAPDGRLVFAIDRDAGIVATVDLAEGAVTAVEPVGKPIAEAALTDGALFLLARDGADVTVLSLRALRERETPYRRDVRIGPPDPDPSARPGALLSLAPAPQALALNRAASSAAVVTDYDTMGDAPPMTAVALRGGIPAAIGVVDRALRETVPGRFEATAAVPPGSWELVMSAGVADRTLCIPFAVPGDGAAARPRFTAHMVYPADGSLPTGPATVTIALAAGDAPLAADRAPVTLVDLATGWRQPAEALRRDDGLFELHLDLPRPGTYGLAPRLHGLAAAGGMILEVRAP